MAIEKMLDLKVPARGQVIRVICLELSRIASHLVWLGTHALDMGAMSVFLYAFREREMILDMFELLSGQRLMGSYMRPGGVWRDLPEEFLPTLETFVNIFPSRVDDYEKLLTNNPLWRDRTEGIGVVEPDEALALGMSGPSLRGSGVNWDIRKESPYSGYEQYDFNVPLGDHGDVYDRFWVRIQEFRESIKIIKQAMKNIPGGAFRSDDRKVVPPPRAELGRSMEAVIHHFKLWTEGFSVPDEEVFMAIESPRGEIGCYLHGTGGTKPRRVHFKTPSFMHISALNRLSQGHMIADLVGIIGSVDIVLGDSDR
jgi:NADH-quinone oxidoreductase subunit D